MPPPIRPTVLAGVQAAEELAERELAQVLAARTAGVISLATGATFRGFLTRLGRCPPGQALHPWTHLDEYLGFGAGEPAGMVHELFASCPFLREEQAAGRFWPVPADGAPQSLHAHAARIAAAGGIALQFLGLGRNGHLAFNEPGTPFDSGFHLAELAASTRADARERFAPAEPPRWAVTAGLATILSARRIVLVAMGLAKAPAVRAMLEGPVTPECPASILQRHANLLVLLDEEAASLLRRRPEQETAR